MEYQAASDLFGQYRLLKKEGRALDERSTLIKYFCDELKREPRVVGIRLGHYNISQLYSLQSAYKDRLTRNGAETARKYWWAVTKTRPVEK